MTTKLRKIGNSVGVIIPADVLSSKNMKEGDEVHVLETPDGVVVTPYARFARYSQTCVRCVSPQRWPQETTRWSPTAKT